MKRGDFRGVLEGRGPATGPRLILRIVQETHGNSSAIPCLVTPWCASRATPGWPESAGALKGLLAEELESHLRVGVRLAQDRDIGLGQDVRLRQLAGLFSHVRVADAA